MTGGEGGLELFSIINQCHASLVVAAVESATRTTFTMTDDVRNYLLSGRGGGRNGSEKTAVERNYGRAGETMITRTICCWGGEGGDDTTNFYDDFVRDKLCMSEGREFLISNFLCDFVSVIFLIIFNRFYRNLSAALFRISPRISR